jgi:hypothetical protein
MVDVNSEGNRIQKDYIARDQVAESGEFRDTMYPLNVGVLVRVFYIRKGPSWNRSAITY